MVYELFLNLLYSDLANISMLKQVITINRSSTQSITVDISDCNMVRITAARGANLQFIVYEVLSGGISETYVGTKLLTASISGTTLTCVPSANMGYVVTVEVFKNG